MIAKYDKRFIIKRSFLPKMKIISEKKKNSKIFTDLFQIERSNLIYQNILFKINYIKCISDLGKSKNKIIIQKDKNKETKYYFTMCC